MICITFGSFPVKALGENKSVNDRLWPLPATPQTARSLRSCRTRRRMLQGQPLSPSSRVQANLPQVARYPYAAGQAWPGSVRRAGTFDARRVAAAEPRAQSKAPLQRFDSTSRETMPLLVSSLTAGATIRSKGRADLSARTNTARSVE